MRNWSEISVMLFWAAVIALNLLNAKISRIGMYGGNDGSKRYSFFAWELPIVWSASSLFCMYLGWFHRPRMGFMFLFSAAAFLLMLYFVYSFRKEGRMEAKKIQSETKPLE